MQVFFARWASGRKVKYRSLTWAEYRKFEQQLRYDCPAGVYEDVYRAVVLEGPKIEDDPVFAAPAGLVEWVARSLLDQNPFNGSYSDVKRAIDMKRGELQSNWLTSARAIVAGIFHYTFKELDEMDAETFFECLAAAEFVSGKQHEPGDPNRKEKKQKQRPKKQLTAAQQEVTERVQQQRQSDPRMPKPAEETVYDPTVTQNEPARPRRKELTPAQELVFERRQQLRR